MTFAEMTPSFISSIQSTLKGPWRVVLDPNETGMNAWMGLVTASKDAGITEDLHVLGA